MLYTDIVVSIIIGLANRVYIYLLTSNTVNITLEIDPFTYTITAILCYTSAVFIGIIINTSISEKSTISYS